MTDPTPESGVLLDAESPWPGLHEFDERAEPFFHGREEEKAALFRLVRDAPLTVLFGGSGLGKTSLLQAGLFPRLRNEQYLPVYVRLDPRHRGAPLIEQAAQAFGEQLRALGVDHPGFGPRGSLWEYLHRTDLELWSLQNHLLTPVFVFDQFEEVFTLGAQSADAVGRLRVDLADLVENRIPSSLVRRMDGSGSLPAGLNHRSQRYRLVLSFREDFLPEIEGWRREMPSLARNRFRLMPMNGDQAFDAVFRTGGELVDETMSEQIVRFVAAARAEMERHRVGAPRAAEDTPCLVPLEGLVVEPALLSLVCTRLNERRKAPPARPKIDQDLLRDTGQAIVTEFYEDSVRDLPSTVRRFIEDELITESGFRNSYPRAEALSREVLTERQLEALVKGRVLRVEPHMGTDRIELIHDLLTDVVRESRDRRRREEERRREQAQRDQEQTERELQSRLKRRRQRIWAAIATLAVCFGIVLAGLSYRIWVAERLRSAEGDLRSGIEQMEGKDYSAALASLVRASSSFENLGEREGQVSALISTARVHALEGHFEEARQACEQARRVGLRARSPRAQGLALENLASLDERQDRLEEALKRYGEALAAYRAAGDPAASGRILERLGAEEEKGKRFDAAAKRYRDASDSYVLAGDYLGVARTKESLVRITPWGTLLDLHTSAAYALRGEKVMVGRSIEGSAGNDISFSSRFVSRKHLELFSEDHSVEDLRSRNGTTVNAEMLPYGERRALRDGDVITLAGVKAVQYRKQSPGQPTERRPGAWGILVDNGPQRFRYLNAPVYTLLWRNGVLSLFEGERRGKDALMIIRPAGGGVSAEDLPDAWRAVATWKQADYQYEKGVLPPEKAVRLDGLPITYGKLSPGGSKERERGPSLQIVPLVERAE